MRKKSPWNILSDGHSEVLAAAFKGKFGIEVETTWSVFDFRKRTTRIDEKPFTKEQHAWIGAFTAGYEAAMKLMEVRP
jgi:hypothetical protein